MTSMLAGLLGCGDAIGASAATATATATPGTPANPHAVLASTMCRSLQQAAAAIPGDGPMLLKSYPSIGVKGAVTGETAGAPIPALPALENVAFVYDNALAGIALSACGAHRDARRIADALVLAAQSDPDYHDGRLRNGYRAGPLTDGKVALPGYWDDSNPTGPKGGFWNQDAYQVGTASGNAAWAALLFLTVYRQTHAPRYWQAAVGQLQWIDSHALNKASPAGYQGGVFGYAPKQTVQTWKSTEHNIDIYAAARWAAATAPGAGTNTGDDGAAADADADSSGSASLLKRMQATAGAFVNAMWDTSGRRFDIGTREDGTTRSTDLSGLDSEVWPLLAFKPVPAVWQGVWGWVDRAHKVPAAGNSDPRLGRGVGYGFKRDPDGVWTEGTAQVATAMQASGKPVPAALWQLLLAQRAPDGMLYATPEPRISTGLEIGPTSTSADFYYYHLPHLGATAWAVLAAQGWNPFDGQHLAQSAQRAQDDVPHQSPGGAR